MYNSQFAGAIRINPLAVCDVLHVGLVTCNPSLCIRGVNETADALIRENKIISVQEGKLAATNVEETKRLKDVVAQCANGADECLQSLCCVRLSDSDGKLSLIANVTSGKNDNLNGNAEAGEPSAIIFLHDIRRALPGYKQIASLFNLTPAEERLLSEVIAGDGLKNAASRLGVSVTTARTHLHRIFQKTETSRQTELLLLVANMPAGRDDLV